VYPGKHRTKCHPPTSHTTFRVGSNVGSNVALKITRKTLLSDTESMKLFLVRDQEAGGSNPLAPTIPFRCAKLTF
jgi:hypothetical protein